MKRHTYKALTIKSRQWVYGYLVGNSIVEDLNGESDPFSQKTWHAIDPETVGQYTGLKDKDGTDIYEGDVLITNSNCELSVIFDNACFYAIHLSDHAIDAFSDRLEYALHFYDCTVIGNIHGNDYFDRMVEDGVIDDISDII